MPIVLAFLVAAAAAAENGDNSLGWTSIEEDRKTREYKDDLRDGGDFDENWRAVLTQALGQLTLPANRPTIEHVRRRIRALFLTDIADDKSHEAATGVVLRFMDALARDRNAEPVVRVNAMLLVGDLRSKDNAPWQNATAPLAAAAGDTTLPMAVRIAALRGLARRAEEAARRASAGNAAIAPPKTALDAVMAILSEQASNGNQSGGHWRVEHDWMAGRAMSILPFLSPSASKATAAVLVAVLEDPKRSVNVRVRAAAALGATTVAASDVDVAKAIESIRALAVHAIETDLAGADRQRLAGGSPQTGGATAPPQGVRAPANSAESQGISEQFCRRAAWRLATLADAIVANDAKGGLATLAGGGREPAEKLAESMRNGAAGIEATPGEKSLSKALVALGRQPAATATPPVQPAPSQPKPADPAESPFENPFGN